jgi:hypothetical protein
MAGQRLKYTPYLPSYPHAHTYNPTHLLLISWAISWKAISTFVASLAEVSRKGMLWLSANACRQT